MKRKLLIALLSVAVIFMICGCSLPVTSAYINGKSYSTANGDKLPVDVGNISLTYQLEQQDMSGVNSIPVTAQLTNKTNVTFADSYYLIFSCVDGSTGNLSYMGSIKPGQTITITGFLLPKTPGYAYKADDISFTSILTGFDPNDEQHGSISYHISEKVYEWDYMPADEYYKK